MHRYHGSIEAARSATCSGEQNCISLRGTEGGRTPTQGDRAMTPDWTATFMILRSSRKAWWTLAALMSLALSSASHARTSRAPIRAIGMARRSEPGTCAGCSCRGPASTGVGRPWSAPTPWPTPRMSSCRVEDRPSRLPASTSRLSRGIAERQPSSQRFCRADVLAGPGIEPASGRSASFVSRPRVSCLPGPGVGDCRATRHLVIASYRRHKTSDRSCSYQLLGRSACAAVGRGAHGSR